MRRTTRRRTRKGEEEEEEEEKERKRRTGSSHEAMRRECAESSHASHSQLGFRVARHGGGSAGVGMRSLCGRTEAR